MRDAASKVIAGHFTMAASLSLVHIVPVFATLFSWCFKLRTVVVFECFLLHLSLSAHVHVSAVDCPLWSAIRMIWDVFIVMKWGPPLRYFAFDVFESLETIQSRIHIPVHQFSFQSSMSLTRPEHLSDQARIRPSEGLGTWHRWRGWAASEPRAGEIPTCKTGYVGKIPLRPYTSLYVGLSPFPVTVANEGL